MYDLNMNVRRNPVHPKPRRWNHELIFKLNREGSFNNEIEKITGCPQSSIRRILRSARFRSNLVSDRHISVTPNFENLVKGSLLGDGCIRMWKRLKNAFYTENHAIAQVDYLLWKYEKFKKFIPTRIYKIKEPKSVMQTSTNVYFTNLYKITYRDGRKTIYGLYENLNALGLAIWVMDDGYWGGKRYTISTAAFSLQENLQLKAYFTEKWGLHPKIQMFRGKPFCLRFNTEDAEHLKEIIKPHVLSCMKYKIGE